MDRYTRLIFINLILQLHNLILQLLIMKDQLITILVHNYFSLFLLLPNVLHFLYISLLVLYVLFVSFVYLFYYLPQLINLSFWFKPLFSHRAILWGNFLYFVIQITNFFLSEIFLILDFLIIFENLLMLLIKMPIKLF